MRVLLQDGRSRRYFGKTGGWVEDAGAGRNFGSHRLASQFARVTILPKFNIVLYSPRIKRPLAVDHGGN